METPQSDPGAWQAERREVVRHMTTEGWSAREIARVLETTCRTVHRDREALGIARPVPPPLTADEIEQAKLLLADGCSITETAATLNRSSSSIGKHCKGLSKLKSDPLRKQRELITRLGL